MERRIEDLPKFGKQSNHKAYVHIDIKYKNKNKNKTAIISNLKLEWRFQDFRHGGIKKSEKQARKVVSLRGSITIYLFVIVFSYVNLLAFSFMSKA